MDFSIDGTALLINVSAILLMVGLMWRLSRNMAAAEQRQRAETKEYYTDLRQELKAAIAELKADIAALRQEFKADNAALRQESKADIAELKAAIAALRQELKESTDKLSVRIDGLSQRTSTLTERVARMEGRTEWPWGHLGATGMATSETDVVSTP